MAKRINPAAGIGIVAVVAALGIGGGFFFVKNAESGFQKEEAEMPESAISSYFDSLSKKDYAKIYEDSMTLTPHLNSKEDYVAKLEEIYSGVKTSEIEYAPDNSDTSKYKLYYNKQYLATLDVSQSTSGSWMASTEFSGDHTYTVEVPTGMSLEINGITVEDSYCVQKADIASNFTQLNDTSIAPKVDRYVLNNLLGEPTITVNGSSDYATLKDVLSDTIFVGKATTDSTIVQAMQNDAVTLAAFPTQDGSLGAISNIAITSSEFYTRLSSLQNNWFTSHDTSSFSNVAASNIIQQSEDTAVGYVTFDYYAHNSEVSRTWHGGYQLTLKNLNGNWVVAGMGINNELNPLKESPEGLE